MTIGKVGNSAGVMYLQRGTEHESGAGIAILQLPRALKSISMKAEWKFVMKWYFVEVHDQNELKVINIV